MSFNIQVEGGKTVRLPTAGKYCDRDIVITATGAAAAPVVQPLEVTENGTYTAPQGVDGYSPVTVNVAGGGEENKLEAFLENTMTTLDSPVSKILGYSCRARTALTKVNLPNATSIATYAFYGCTGITSFNAPKVTSLGTYAFYQCSKITEINFPLATSVPSTCFYQCTALARADFGAAKSIAGNGFAYCSKLKTLILRYTAAMVTLNSSSFAGASFSGYVYVPAALIETYRADSTWSDAVADNKFRAIEDYPDICG